MSTDKIILGIDPGTVIMGYGAIHLQGNALQLLGAGIISLQKIKEHPARLKKIFEGTTTLLKQFKADELAIEAPFYGKNVQSMLKLGRAQGVALAAALVRYVPIFEYSPKRIKQSITGNGNASKEQVAAILRQLLGIKAIPHYLDATDALGAAMCHYFSSCTRSLRRPLAGGKTHYSGWKDFLKSKGYAD